MRKLIIAAVVLASCSVPKEPEYTPEELQNIRELDSMQKQLDSIEHIKDSLGI